ncbi:MAG: DMT family transporter [Bulleidia sp.]|nr:DMT family transporter [Bulleidia sp.]
MNRDRKGAFLTLFGGFCWGASGSMGQYLFTRQGMDSRWLVPIRLGLAGIILFLYCLKKYGVKKTFAPWRTKKDAVDLLIYGLAGISCCQFLYFLTIQLSSAAIGTILQDLSPVMILLVSCMMAKRKPLFNEILSIILALVGVFLLTTHGSLDSLSVPVSALITGVLCAVCVTIYNVEPKHLLDTYPVTLLQGWAFLLGSSMFTLIFRPWTFHYVPNGMGLLGIAFVVVVGNVLAFTAYMTGVALIGPEKGILYGFAEPVTAAVISTTMLGSHFTIYDALGFACIFLMMVCISWKPEHSSKTQTAGR